MSRLMGRPTVATQTVEIQNKPTPKTEVNSSPTSYKPVTPHNPFNVRADPPKMGGTEQSVKIGETSTQAELEFQTARNSLGAYKTPVQLQDKSQQHVNKPATKIKDCEASCTSENIVLQTPQIEESLPEVEPKKNERVDPDQAASLPPVSPSIPPTPTASTSISMKPALKFESITPTRQVIKRNRNGYRPILSGHQCDITLQRLNNMMFHILGNRSSYTNDKV